MENGNTALSERLRNLRFMRGYSVNQVAKMVGKAPNTIINWESGKVSPDVDVVQELCKIYNVRPNEMFGWEPCLELDKFITEKQEILKKLEIAKREKVQIEAKIKQLEGALKRRTVFDDYDGFF